ncbi:MAG TPA: autotransporter-associated beta strand repeat-containing protein [Chthoniobacterales bacterium]|nr:autotransporter-associated beta strand repeat-containing protein [Chthoniobacterales bacterium]
MTQTPQQNKQDCGKPCNRRLGLLLVLTLLLSVASTNAGSATWSSNPASNVWNNANNWSPSTVPNGSADIATFSTSSLTTVYIGPNTEVSTINFLSGASAFTLSPYQSVLTVSGTGIVNNSGIVQNFVQNLTISHADSIRFKNSATAGTQTVFTNNGSNLNGRIGGYTEFFDTSTAAQATFVNNGGMASGASGGATLFHNSSTAGSATFVANGGTVTNASGGSVFFFDSSTAGTASFTANSGLAGSTTGGDVIFDNASTAGSGHFTTNGASFSNSIGGEVDFDGNSTAGGGVFVNNGSEFSYFGAAGGRTRFFFQSTAGSATLIANSGSAGGDGGSISFSGDSTGGTARVLVFGTGSLDISQHNDPGVTIGSLEGTGLVFLGARNLTIGSNSLSTTFSGVIQDGDINGGGGSGSVTKTGTGYLTLSGVNTYTGPTTVNSGGLIVDGSITSAVTVNGGTLAGSGTTKDVTVNSGGTLAPGDSPGILTVQGNLKLMMGANYLVALNGAVVGTQYSQTNVFGTVSINGATLLVNLGFTPAIGTTFIIINNDSTDSVAGTFDGLPEGSTVTVNGESFTISYQGGDGNDVVLTAVVPEPATLTLLSTGVAGLAIRRLLRRR